MKFKVLKPVVHGQKLHAPGEASKPTILNIPDEHLEEKHIKELIEQGVLKPIEGKPEPKA